MNNGKYSALVLSIMTIVLFLSICSASRTSPPVVLSTDRPAIEGWLYDQWYVPRWNAYGQWTGYDRSWGANSPVVYGVPTGPVGDGLIQWMIDGCYFVAPSSICVDDSHPFKLPLKIPTAAGSSNGMRMSAFYNLWPAASTIYIGADRIGVWPPDQYASRNSGDYEVKWYMWVFWPFRTMVAYMLIDYHINLYWYISH